MSENIQVPQGWEVKKLREVVEINNTRVLSEQLEPLSISAGIGFVNQTEKFGRDLAGKQYEKYIKIKKYDFAYNKGNSKKYPQGCIYLLKDREHAAIPNVFECFRIKNYNCFYYEQLFISGFLNKQLYRLINAGVRNDGLLNLNSENFYSCYIPVPPLEEQKKIADILSLWDKAIEQTKDLIAYKEKQKKGLMQALLTGKKRLNGFTDEWKTVKLGEIVDIQKGEQVNKTILDDIGQYPVINGGITPSGYYSNFNRLAETITISEGGNSCGYVSIQHNNFWSGGHCYTLHHTNIKIDNNFLFQILKFNENNIMRLRVGSGLPNIQLKSLYEYKLNITFNILEQKAIADILSSADKEIELLNKQLELYTEQKKGLMQNLLTGKVRV